MPVEIERKFLVKTSAWRDQVTRSERLRDGLIARDDDLKVRVRSYGDRTTLCVKSARKGISRDEFEYEIPADHASAIFAHCAGRVLEKTRHYVPGVTGTWEVDVYHGVLEGIVIAEIELPSESTIVSLPDWVGEEITGDPSYSTTTLLAERARRTAAARARCEQMADL